MREDETLIDIKWGDEISPEERKRLTITEYEWTGVPPKPSDLRHNEG